MMTGHGRCPKCGYESNQFVADQATAGDGLSGPFIGALSICCAKCRTILGVVSDPIALAAEIALRVVKHQATTL